ncbi:MAG TPA: hypothetical protein PKD90_16835, partial [Phnomibacter sp.]|nr:hypothetical protein [Phnomibacter sp.]
WAPATTGKVSVVEIRNSATGLSEKVGYLVETKQMGWMSVARPATVPDQTAIVTVSLPHGFQNRNTNVYITPAKMPTLCYLTPDNNNKLWFNRSVPVRTPFMIFTITRHNNKYFLGQARSTEAGISAATHFAIRPQPVSFEELLKFLKNL